MEKHLADCDTTRTQLAGRLSKEEAKNQQLQQEVEQLKLQLEQYSTSHTQPVEIKSIQRPGESSRLGHGVGGSVAQAPVTAMLKGYTKNTPPHTPPEARRNVAHVVRESPERDGVLGKPTPPLPTPPHQGKSVLYTPAVVSGGVKTPDRTVVTPAERPVPAEKPADLSARMAAMSAGTASSQQGPTMFTTPSGTRITVAVGGAAAGPRKPGITGRGAVPPPVPPNKPQVVLPTANQHRHLPPSSSSSSSSSPSSSSPNPPPHPKPRALIGGVPAAALATNTQITVANDKITISSAQASVRPVSVNANQSNMFQTNTTSTAADHLARQKPTASQVCAGASYK